MPELPRRLKRILVFLVLAAILVSGIIVAQIHVRRSNSILVRVEAPGVRLSFEDGPVRRDRLEFIIEIGASSPEQQAWSDWLNTLARESGLRILGTRQGYSQWMNELHSPDEVYLGDETTHGAQVRSIILRWREPGGRTRTSSVRLHDPGPVGIPARLHLEGPKPGLRARLIGRLAGSIELRFPSDSPLEAFENR